MRRLKHAEVSTTRAELRDRQNCKCGICQLPVSLDSAVLDHDHRTGAVRGVLHRGCNSLLGKLENNAAKYGVSDIGSFTNGVAQYLRNHMTNITGLLHPTHKTEDEKILKRRKQQKAYRELKKLQPSI